MGCTTKAHFIYLYIFFSEGGGGQCRWTNTKGLLYESYQVLSTVLPLAGQGLLIHCLYAPKA